MAKKNPEIYGAIFQGKEEPIKRIDLTGNPNTIVLKWILYTACSIDVNDFSWHDKGEKWSMIDRVPIANDINNIP